MNERKSSPSLQGSNIFTLKSYGGSNNPPHVTCEDMARQSLATCIARSYMGGGELSRMRFTFQKGTDTRRSDPRCGVGEESGPEAHWGPREARQ